MDVFSRLMMDDDIFRNCNQWPSGKYNSGTTFIFTKRGFEEIYSFTLIRQLGVYAGLGIYDMQYISPDVATIYTGMAASMGQFFCVPVHLKGSALPHARVMIHQPLGGAQGQASDIEITAREILKLKMNFIKLSPNTAVKKLKKLIRQR